jgi:hypothetical protein
MRSRVLFPVLQTLSMLLIVWAPWSSRVHQIDIVRRDGHGSRYWTLPPTSAALDWAEGINLPAAALVTPVEFAIRKAEALPNHKIRFFGFWIVGLLCWYMVGRCVDDVLRWRHSGVLPRKHPGDVAFALIAVPSAILLADVFISDGTPGGVLFLWSLIWVTVTVAALVLRLLQIIRQRRKPTFS